MQLASNAVEQRIAALSVALQYNRAGVKLLAQVLQQDQSWRVRCSAYWLLQKVANYRVNQLLQGYHPYQKFRYLSSLKLDTTTDRDTDFISALAVRTVPETGQQILAASSSRQIEVWDLHTSNLLQCIPDYGAIAIAHNGQTLLSSSGSYNSSISLWDIKTGTKSGILSGNANNGSRDTSIDAIAISPDDEILVSTSSYYGKIKVWHLPTGKLLYTCDGHKPVIMHPNGHSFISSSKDGSIKIWSLHRGVLMRTISSPQREITAIAISPDGQMLATSNWDGTIYLWHLPNCELLYTLTHSSKPASIAAIAIDPDSNTLVSTCHRDSVKLWNLHTGEIIHTLANYPNWVSCATFSPDGNKLIVGSWKGQIDIWGEA